MCFMGNQYQIGIDVCMDNVKSFRSFPVSSLNGIDEVEGVEWQHLNMLISKLPGQMKDEFC